jgi:hypothetical protein
MNQRSQVVISIIQSNYQNHEGKKPGNNKYLVGDPEARLGGVWINGKGYFLKCFSLEKHMKIMLFLFLFFKFIFDISISVRFKNTKKNYFEAKTNSKVLKIMVNHDTKHPESCIVKPNIPNSFYFVL